MFWKEKLFIGADIQKFNNNENSWNVHNKINITKCHEPKAYNHIPSFHQADFEGNKTTS